MIAVDERRLAGPIGPKLGTGDEGVRRGPARHGGLDGLFCAGQMQTANCWVVKRAEKGACMR